MDSDARAVYHPDTNSEESLSDVSCVPVGHYIWPGMRDQPFVEGLILQKEGSDDHSYIRPGTFKVNSREGCEELGLEFRSEDSLRELLR